MTVRPSDVRSAMMVARNNASTSVAAIQKAGCDTVASIGTGLVEISYGSNHLTCASDGVGHARTLTREAVAHRDR